MNQEQARNLVRQTLTEAFDKTRFRNFVLELLNEFDESKAFARNIQYIKKAFSSHISRFERLGTYTSPDQEKLDVLIVHLTDQSKLARARTAIRNFVADHLKERDRSNEYSLGDCWRRIGMGGSTDEHRVDSGDLSGMSKAKRSIFL